MTKLESYFFGPVSALRVLFLVRSVLFVTAVDALRMAYVGLGNDRYRFNELAIAHFDLLDQIQPSPSAPLRVGVLAVLAVAALLSLWSPRRVLLSIVALLQTWTWSMSILDNYQHHYFLSIVLWFVVALPYVRWSDRRRQIEAGAFAALAASIGITYVFTAIAKLDTVWTEGAVILRLIEPLGLGVSARVAGLLAWSVIVVELYIGVAYLGAPRRGSITAFVFLAIFHLSAEWVLDLSIGAFSFYMVALAIAFQFPALKKDRVAPRVLQHDDENDCVRLYRRLAAAGHGLGAEHDPSCTTPSDAG